jgi:hypothetical protein
MYKAPREAGIAENSGDQPASYLMRSARRPKASFTYPSFTSVCCHSSFQAVRQLGAHCGRSGFSIAACQPNMTILFTSVFSSSEEAQERKLIGSLASALAPLAAAVLYSPK